MKRRTFMAGLGAAVALPPLVQAQQAALVTACASTCDGGAAAHCVILQPQ